MKKLFITFLAIVSGFTAKSQCHYSVISANRAFVSIEKPENLIYSGKDISGNDETHFKNEFQLGTTMGLMDSIELSVQAQYISFFNSKGKLEFEIYNPANISFTTDNGSSDLVRIYKTTTGNSGSRISTIEVQGLQFMDFPSDAISFQVAIYEADNHIEFSYGNRSISSNNPANGLTYVGISEIPIAEGGNHFVYLAGTTNSPELKCTGTEIPTEEGLSSIPAQDWTYYFYLSSPSSIAKMNTKAPSIKIGNSSITIASEIGTDIKIFEAGSGKLIFQDLSVDKVKFIALDKISAKSSNIVLVSGKNSDGTIWSEKVSLP